MNKSFKIIIILSIVSAIFFLCMIFFPKNIVNNDKIYKFLSNNVSTEETKLAYIDYFIYESTLDFEKYFEADIKKEMDKAKDNIEFLVFKLNPKNEVSFKGNNIIYDESIELNNCKFYIAKNVDIFSFSLPSEIVYSELIKSKDKINNIYNKIIYIGFGGLGTINLIIATAFFIKYKIQQKKRI